MQDRTEYKYSGLNTKKKFNLNFIVKLFLGLIFVSILIAFILFCFIDVDSSIEHENSTNPMNLSIAIRKGSRFDNPWSSWKQNGFISLLKFMFFEKNKTNLPSDKKILDELLPVIEINEQQLNDFYKEDSEDKIKVIWIGHATSLLNLKNKIILMDPVFSDRASLFQWIGPKRYRHTPISIDKIPKIDVVLLSHNHYDHLDYNSILSLHKKFGNSIDWLIPLRSRKWFESLGISDYKISEFDWWKSKEIQKLNFTFVPAQHWSSRSPFDRNKSLWGGWVVQTEKKRIYFAGDTGYCPVFEEIGKLFGPFDLSFIPIGAYEPRWFMKPVHVNPEEAVQIHIDVKSINSIGIHWGTFAMAYEYFMAPKYDLIEALNKKNMSEKNFTTLKHGYTYLL